jgi:DNA polymerase-3 subunit gamma/tau
LPDAIPEDLKEVVNNWRGIVGQILRKSPALGTVLQAAILSIGEDQRLLIAVTNGIDKDLIEKEEHMTLMKDIIASLIQKQVDIKVKFIDTSKDQRNEVPDLSKIIKAPIVYED